MGLPRGVPQSSILVLFLFLIYVYDMKAAVKFKLVLYADDSALLASSSDVTEIEEILKFKKNMFGAMRFIYYINRSIATKGDSTYLGY